MFVSTKKILVKKKKAYLDDERVVGGEGDVDDDAVWPTVACGGRHLDGGVGDEAVFNGGGGGVDHERGPVVLREVPLEQLDDTVQLGGLVREPLLEVRGLPGPVIHQLVVDVGNPELVIERLKNKQ